MVDRGDVKIKLHKGQYEVATDIHRFRVICAGRRWGKSVVAQLIVLKWALDSAGLYWIVSPTYRQSKQIHWRQLLQIVPQALIQKKNEVELSITLKNGSVLELKGAENPDALRGVKLRGLVIDEIASIRNWDWLWNEVLRPTLTDYQAPALFISTPKGFNHFYDLYQLGQTESDYKSWRFTSYDNPYIPATEIDLAKKELSEDTFAQEYMADFRRATGLAFKLFDRTVHVIEPFDVPREWDRGRGFDYGSTHATASLRMAVDPYDNWFIERTYKNKERVIKDHADIILAQDYGLSMMPMWGDPSGAQWFREFEQYGLYIEPANKEVGQGARGWVEYCIERVNQRLKVIPGHTVNLPDGRSITNAPKFFILNTHENQELIKEMELLRWRETSSGETVPVLDEAGDPNGHFDLTAALRYLAVSYSKPVSSFERNDFSKWQI